MAYPVKVYPKNKGPKWLSGLDKYIETPKSDPIKRADAKATVENHGGDRQVIDEATYVEKGR